MPVNIPQETIEKTKTLRQKRRWAALSLLIIDSLIDQKQFEAIFEESKEQFFIKSGDKNKQRFFKLEKKEGKKVIAHIAKISRVKLKKNSESSGHFAFKYKKNQYIGLACFCPAFHGQRVKIRIYKKSELKKTFGKIALDKKTENSLIKYFKSDSPFLLFAGENSKEKLLNFYALGKKLPAGDTTLFEALEKLPQKKQNSFPFFDRDKIDTKKFLISLPFSKKLFDALLFENIRAKNILYSLPQKNAIDAIHFLLQSKISFPFIKEQCPYILAEKSLKKSCPKCQEKTKLNAKEKRSLEKALGKKLPKTLTFIENTGCKYCKETGHQGYFQVFELFDCNKHLSPKPPQKTQQDLSKYAKKSGFENFNSKILPHIKAKTLAKSEIFAIIEHDT